MKPAMKKALVTGASEGIGLAIARALSAEGYIVTGVSRSENKLKDVARQLDGEYITADLSTGSGQDAIAAALKNTHYDLLVNNAGVGTSGPFTAVTLDRQTALMELNCMALMKLSYAFLSNARAGDALVNVSSVLAFMPMPDLGLYSATKSFVTAFSESLWIEQRKRDVYVMALHPGLTATDFQAHAGGTAENRPQSMGQTPDQVAKACVTALQGRSKPVVISGTQNALFASLPRFLPRKAVAGIMGRIAEKI
jgi:short-subunit dehydrogenase